MAIEMNKELNRDPSVSLFIKPNQLLLDLSGQYDGPCLSIYLATHRSFPENSKDPIVFNNLIRDLEKSLKEKCTSAELKSLLEPLRKLKEDREFWNHTQDGLAVFVSKEFFKVVKVQRSVPELAIVSNSFHIKPLLRISQTTDRYQILSLDSRGPKLYEGNRDVLDEVEMDSEVPSTIDDIDMEFNRNNQYSERFYRAIDEAILKHHSRKSNLPLFLAAISENGARFRALSRNPYLMEEGINVHSDTISLDELRERAWKLVKPFYDARLEELIEVFQEAQSKDLGSDNIDQIAMAALKGQVSTLLVEADRIVPGHINLETGAVEQEEFDTPGVDDLLDDLAECVLSKGGNIIVAPEHLMPTDKGLAAIYRY